ncbi:DUF2625 family protein [Embleya sp. NPDC056575]|uniref:DUF2625 family protein n=1 Tax=unclassified Embleya TaxID=2699296 RepID=UPI0036CD28D6
MNWFPGTFDPVWRSEVGPVVALDVLGGVFAPSTALISMGPMILVLPARLSNWPRLPLVGRRWGLDARPGRLGVSGQLDEFYVGLRWRGLEEEVRAVSGDQGESLFPPLWSAEVRQEMSVISRCASPVQEPLGVAWGTC